MVDDLQVLEQEFCPPLDGALVHAIYSDYAGIAGGLQAARELLEGIKQAAAVEQATDFDPSGSSGGGTRSDQRSSNGADADIDMWASQTTETDYATLSNDVSLASLEGTSRSGSADWSEGGFFSETEHFDTPTKEALLAETFPTLRPDLVAHILKKCHNDFSKATDELLNRVYFEDLSPSFLDGSGAVKGIDAFSEEYHVPQRGKKSRARRRQKAPALHDAGLASTPHISDAGITSMNKWSEGNRDVHFITSRTSLSAGTVASLYHSKAASLPATIMALAEKDIAEHQGMESDATCVQQALDLTTFLPALELEHALALIRLTAASTVEAQDLAKAMIAQPGTMVGPKGQTQLVPRYVPVNLSDSVVQATGTPCLPPSAVPRTSTTLAAARGHAFTQASAAYRKGKSTPLMKAAAGYYAQVGRDLNANLRAMNEVDADALVTSQSSSTHLDLHGVSVSSATRIARERARVWWDGLGEQKIPGGGRHGVGDGYRIVTGLGRHSEGGKGKIGPAVVRTLVKDGWKIEVGSGELVVLGRVRR